MNKLTIPERHLLRVARDTLKMPDAMARVMGGPSKAEARAIIQRLTEKKFRERRVRDNSHLVGKMRRKRWRGGRKLFTKKRLRTRRRASGKRRRNPTVGILAANPRGMKVAKVISTHVEEVRYRHSQDRHFYKHRFGPGVRLELLTDGSLRLCHPAEKLWDRFA